MGSSMKITFVPLAHVYGLGTAPHHLSPYRALRGVSSWWGVCGRSRDLRYRPTVALTSLLSRLLSEAPLGRTCLLRIDWSLTRPPRDSAKHTTTDQNNHIVIGWFPPALHEGEEVLRAYANIPSILPAQSRSSFRISTLTRIELGKTACLMSCAKQRWFSTRTECSRNDR